MKKPSKSEASEKIKLYFANENLDSEKTRKIKRLAMRFNLKLGKYRARFCKKCYADLKDGKVRVTRDYKIIDCAKCKFRNKIKLNQ